MAYSGIKTPEQLPDILPRLGAIPDSHRGLPDSCV